MQNPKDAIENPGIIYTPPRDLFGRSFLMDKKGVAIGLVDVFPSERSRVRRGEPDPFRFHRILDAVASPTRSAVGRIIEA